jgi:hypothetical protein
MHRVEPVDVALEPLDVTREDPRPRRRTSGGDGELGLGYEQLVLEPPDELARLPPALGKQRSRKAQERPELVERPVGAKAEGVLGYARTAGEAGRSMVARAGIETRDVLASGRPASSSSGELKPWTGQNEMWSTSLCLASCRHSRQMNPLRSLQAIPIASMLQPFPVPGS